MNDSDLVSALNEHYKLNFTNITLLREGGSSTYSAFSGEKKYFLKRTGPAFSDTIKSSVAVNLFLQKKGFSVPRLILSPDSGEPFLEHNGSVLVLYEHLEASEINMERDAEEVGDLLGQLHRLMDDYPGRLIRRRRSFYLDRYIEILEKKQYPRAGEFMSIGERLWSRVEQLPRAYSHGDMYCGNIERGADGKLYILDYDTSCNGFPLYDLALICNRTDYFTYDDEGLPRTLAIYRRLLPEYLKVRQLTGCGERSLCDLIALYHFALQATIIEINGLNCVGEAFFDRQLLWLNKWERQAGEYFRA